MDEDRIIVERISGKSVRAIAKAAPVSVAEVNRVIDAWAEEAIGDQLRKPACVWNSSGSTNDGSFFRRADNDADVRAGYLSQSSSKDDP